ncbi:MAG: 16S rRNA (guanine(527)-N(7))-methyltransferase RsmG [Coxiellaceae bacterium]|nr:16S rRNA (guanine(527)-N(7))-methyltransferase RsmG [Coxiellaceae bacterium]
MKTLDQKQFNTALQQLPFAIDENQTKQLAEHIRLLNKWNKVYNLTAITDIEQQISHHVLDSLAVAPYIKDGSVLDVGTGAGFPGIALAIMRPDQKVTLLDSNSKKTRFLVQAVAELQLSLVDVVHSRVESYRADPLFDAIITRAVGKIADTIALARHLLRPGGRFYFMKGKLPEHELDTFDDHVICHKIDVPLLHEERHLIEIQL